ncbi:lysine/arginine/ornithine transport system substrate-binding protein [Paraburkholderia sp. WC7.3g]|uniref:ABC transporter substrate-binding protein n=1 Tax=Paraburkholderia sp. WC7.3g TaxID=2991070 RepID=UPI003D20F8C1
MKVITTLLLAFIATSLSTSASAQDPKELRFGVDSSYPPFESKSPDGRLVGFDIDLGNEICARMKVKCVWVENSFDGIIAALQARKFDAINSSLSKNAQRAAIIDFTDKLYAPIEKLVVKGGSGLAPTVESLKGKRVGVLQGSTQETYARKYWGGKGVDIVSYPTQDQAWADLVSGRLDAVFAFGPQAEGGFLKTDQGRSYGFAGGPEIRDAAIFGNGVCIGVRKGDEVLVNAINNAIDAIRKDGTYDRIAKKYFTYDVYGG